MIFLNKIFINFYRRKNQFLFLKKKFFSDGIIPNDSAESSAALRTLSAVDFNYLRRPASQSLLEGLEDAALSAGQWAALCGAVRTALGPAFLARRLPLVLLEALLGRGLPRLADSFLRFLLGSEEHRSPLVLLSLLESLARHGRTEHARAFAELFRREVRPDQFEVLFEKYVAALLGTEMRGEALKLLRGGGDGTEMRGEAPELLRGRGDGTEMRGEASELLRGRGDGTEIRGEAPELLRGTEHGLLRRVILTSPFTESWSDIKHYFNDYLSLNRIPDPVILEKIMRKIPLNNVSILTEFLDELCFSKSHIWTKNIITLTSLAEKFGLQMKLNSVKELSCDACGDNIPEICLDEKSCRDVADIIMIDVMKIESTEKLYQNSSPSEILRFNSFIKTCNFPFDCVIDYLNLLFLKQRRYKKYGYDEDKSYIIDCLLELNKQNPNIRNICLVGKQHSWSGMSIGELIDDIKYKLRNHRKLHGISNVSYYSSDKMTKDDVLALYIALKSGPNCSIVSNDEYRDHRSQIKDRKLKEFMKDWQSYCQILINKQFSNSNMLFQVPSKYVKHVTYNEEKNIYHIPYAVYMEDKSVKTSFCTDVQWACLKC